MSSLTLSGYNVRVPWATILVALTLVGAQLSLPVLTSAQTISSAPLLRSPGDGVSGQPRNLTFYWSAVDGATGYIWQMSPNIDFGGAIDVAAADSLSFVDRPIDAEGTIYWRVRGQNDTEVGPWSDAWSLTLSTDTLKPGISGPLIIDDSFMFVEIAGPDDRFACGQNAGSIFGCDEIGGNFVYSSLNGSGEYIMYHEGVGSEDVIGPFGPNDYEIRFTPRGSYAYNSFTTGTAIWVPFEVWDVGSTYTGTAINPNDPVDDVQMIPILFEAGRNECEWAYDAAVPGAFGVFDGSTQRVYAYYATASYASWEAIVKPLVVAHADGCPNVKDLTGGTIDDEIDFDRGRPIQRTIFNGDSQSDPPHPPFDVAVRFYTMDPVRPSAPVASAPATMSDLLQPSSLWWTGPPGDVSYQLEVSSISGTDVDTLVATPYFEVADLRGGTEYSWRVRATNANGTSEWSSTWTFSVVSGVAVEETGLPNDFALAQNYPNPFNPTTTISYAIPQAAEVALTVVDVLGRQVKTLASGAKPAGTYEVSFDATGLPSGVCFYRLRAGAYVETKRMVIVK
jgi:hypothetical protein